jgi:mRNA-degrading endonuclease RelE of RelBE toxin-antitoxin system
MMVWRARHSATKPLTRRDRVMLSCLTWPVNYLLRKVVNYGQHRRRLRDWPTVSGAKALSGNLAGWYRIRTGDYRIRFRVEPGRITVDKIGHRKDVYED